MIKAMSKAEGRQSPSRISRSSGISAQHRNVKTGLMTGLGNPFRRGEQRRPSDRPDGVSKIRPFCEATAKKKRDAVELQPILGKRRGRRFPPADPFPFRLRKRQTGGSRPSDRANLALQ
jgi:hypothetical protein